MIQRSQWSLVTCSACILAMLSPVLAIADFHGLHPRWESILNSDFEIVIPYHVDHAGNFRSHDLTLAHESHQKHMRRETRDTSEYSREFSQASTDQNRRIGTHVENLKNYTSFPSEKMHSDPHLHDLLHIRIHTLENLYHLHLSPSHHFVSPFFKIHRRFNVKNEKGETVRETREEEADIDLTCFYRGDLAHGADGTASLSACEGLMGYINTATDNFIIEPIPEYLFSSSLDQQLPQTDHQSLNNDKNCKNCTENHSNKSHRLSRQTVNHERERRDLSYYSRKLNNKLNKLYNKHSDNSNAETQQVFNKELAQHHVIYRHHWSPQKSASVPLSAPVRSSISSSHAQDLTCVQGTSSRQIAYANNSTANSTYVISDVSSSHSINPDSLDHVNLISNSNTFQPLNRDINANYIRQFLKSDTISNDIGKHDINSVNIDKFQNMDFTSNDINKYKNSDINHERTRNKRSLAYNPRLENKSNFVTDFGARDSRVKNEWANSSRSVETIVVVDGAMIRNHGEQNVTIYALTLLNMMNNLYHDSSIGSKINFTILALILLEGEEDGLNVNEKADQTLHNFCHWQSNLKGLHHDHAILLTGVDICSYDGQFCDTLGFAPIEGMCKRFLSCTVNEDNGLGTAFTITHEAGHNFGMRHDGDDNHCMDLAGSIMAPKIQGNRGVFKWSACSRRYLDKFLSSHQSWCLQDEPQQLSQLRFPNKLPGQLYDADIQCKWQFGAKSRMCTYDFAKDLCSALWCHTGGRRCETKFLPAAEGTSCGYQKWCRRGMCMGYGDEGPKPIDGAWSGWSPWTMCSRSCAGGVKYRHRACNRPKPQYGGTDCKGDERMIKLCSMEECPDGPVDLRGEQCSVYDRRPFRGHKYTWLPYVNINEEKEECKLFCKDTDRKIYFEMNHRVDDGTACLINTKGVCVAGECRNVGCDHVVGSNTKVDHCGVCGGNNLTCQVISGSMSSHYSANYYHYVMRIPENARRISISEQVRSTSYIALRSVNGVYFLNGNWRVSWPGTKQFAGCLFDYQRPYDKPEIVTTDGPLDQPIIVEVLALRETPTIVYSYTIPRVEAITPPPPKHNYTWNVIESQCSASCASGQKQISIKCLQDLSEEVDDGMCDEATKPKTGTVACNEEPCPPEWIFSEWAECSKTCGGGSKKRKVACMQVKSENHTVKVRSQYCRHLEKPSRRERCNKQECPPRWHTGRWTECSASCGQGKRRRQVVCRSKHNKLQHEHCAHSPKPADTERCEVTPCYTDVQWYMSQWSQCSTTCGPGIKTRILRCSGQNFEQKFEILPGEECQYLERPMLPLQEHCTVRECVAKEQPKWFLSPWSQCSVTCGKGTQIRLIRCLDRISARRTTGCLASDKPETTQTCDTKIPCTAAVVGGGCRDDWHMCHLVPKNNLCGHHYYGKQCCASCSGQPSARALRHG